VARTTLWAADVTGRAGALGPGCGTCADCGSAGSRSGFPQPARPHARDPQGADTRMCQSCAVWDEPPARCKLGPQGATLEGLPAGTLDAGRGVEVPSTCGWYCTVASWAGLEAPGGVSPWPVALGGYRPPPPPPPGPGLPTPPRPQVWRGKGGATPPPNVQPGADGLPPDPSSNGRTVTFYRRSVPNSTWSFSRF
jgi:hypothetical protein